MAGGDVFLFFIKNMDQTLLMPFHHQVLISCSSSSVGLCFIYFFIFLSLICHVAIVDIILQSPSTQPSCFSDCWDKEGCHSPVNEIHLRRMWLIQVFTLADDTMPPTCAMYTQRHAHTHTSTQKISFVLWIKAHGDKIVVVIWHMPLQPIEVLLQHVLHPLLFPNSF